MGKIILVLTLLLLIAILNSFGQTNPTGEMQKNYKLYNRSISLGEECGSVHLNAITGEGIAWVKYKKFKLGTIDFDAKGRDEFQASFVGIAFHGVNEAIYEAIDFGTFNFQQRDFV